MRVYLTVMIVGSIVRFSVGMTKDRTRPEVLASLSLIAAEIVGLVFVWLI